VRRVILAGAAGRLGSRLRSDLGDGWEITALSRGGEPGTVPFEICSPGTVAGLGLGDCDLVVNCAAVSSTSECGRNPGMAWAVNCAWPALLASETAGLGVPLVHFSTDLVYGGGTPPYREGSPSVPSCLYGWTKLLGDRAVLDRNPLAAVLRTSVLVGRAGSARPTFSEELLQGSVRRVWVDSFRHHTSLGWLVSVTSGIAESGLAGLFHAAGLHGQSRAAFAEELYRRTGFPGTEPEQGYSPDGVPRNLALDMSRACSMLPYRPLDPGESIDLEYPTG